MESADESFEKLEVWRRSHGLSIEVYRLLADCRDWGFKDQITRSANSISDNIAEGAERTSKAEFKQFLGYAKGSAGETRSQMLRRSRYLSLLRTLGSSSWPNSAKSPA